MTSPGSYKQQCPHCQTMILIKNPSLAGRTVHCPTCKKQLVVGGALPPPLARTPLRALPGPPPASQHDEEIEQPESSGGAARSRLLIGGGLLALGVMAFAMVILGGFFSLARPSSEPAADNREETPRRVVVSNTNLATEKPRGTDPTETKDRQLDPPPRTADARRFALLVAVQEYDSPDWRDLRYTESDVTALAATLKSREYQDEDIIVMTNSLGKQAQTQYLLPTVTNIRKQLARLTQQCQPDDVLLVALTGHGCQMESGKQLFCPYKANLKDESTLLSLQEVVGKLAGSKAGMKLLLVDACREMVGTRRRPPNEGEVEGLTSGPTEAGVITYWSCSPGERSYEIPDLKRGLFFELLLRGLTSAADYNGDGKVMWEELNYYIGNNSNFLAAKYGHTQTPYFKGESNKTLPVAAGMPRRAETADKTGVPLSPHDLLVEDFSLLTSGKLPRDWYGPGFGRQIDEKNQRACLEVTKPHGAHWLCLPPFKGGLYGDWVVEIEFLLNGHRGVGNFDQPERFSHVLAMRLEGENGLTRALHIDHKGEVYLPDSQPRATKEFKEYQVNRLRLERHGDSYSVIINDGVASAARLGYAGPIEAIHLGMHGGIPNTSPELNFPARIYSVKVARQASTAAALPAPGTTPRFGEVLLQQDFTKLEQRAVLPEGWNGDAFTVLQDELFHRRCVEVTKTEGTHFITLPKFDPALSGDLMLECWCLLNGHDRLGNDNVLGKPAHELHLRLEGAALVPLHFRLDYEGTLRLGELEPRKCKGFNALMPNRIRLVRLGDKYQFICNDIPNGELTLPAGAIDTIRLGLTGGVPRTGTDKNFAARLYCVKVVRLPGAASNKPKPFVGLAEDFWSACNKEVPRGWLNAQNLAVLTPLRSERPFLVSHPGLELVSTEASQGTIDLPALETRENFVLMYEFEMPNEFGFVNVSCGGSKTKPLILTAGKEKLAVVGFPPADVAKFIKYKEVNRLEIIRANKQFGFKLNGTLVGGLVGKNAPVGPFERIQLGIAIEKKDQPSPRILRFLLKQEDPTP